MWLGFEWIYCSEGGRGPSQPCGGSLNRPALLVRHINILSLCFQRNFCYCTRFSKLKMEIPIWKVSFGAKQYYSANILQGRF